MCQLPDKLAFTEGEEGICPYHAVKLNLSKKMPAWGLNAEFHRYINLICPMIAAATEIFFGSAGFSFFLPLEPTGAGTLVISCIKSAEGVRGWRKHPGIPCRNRRAK